MPLENSNRNDARMNWRVEIIRNSTDRREFVTVIALSQDAAIAVAKKMPDVYKVLSATPDNGRNDAQPLHNFIAQANDGTYHRGAIRADSAAAAKVSVAAKIGKGVKTIKLRRADSATPVVGGYADAGERTVKASQLTNRFEIKINGKFRKVKMVTKMPLIEQVAVIFQNGDTIRYALDTNVEIKA